MRARITTPRQRRKLMDELIEDYLMSAKTMVPQLNPAFDPSQYHPELIGVLDNKTK
ncbi:MAG: hypothetical protein WCI31_04360 [Prolixibacteraceae bacterium]